MSATEFVVERVDREVLEVGRGLKGEQGEEGDPGPEGDVGPPGPQGIQGVQGEQGVPGGPGPQGIPGPQGDQGIQGEPGPQGDQGIQGVEGPQGDQGDQGVAGPPGPVGLEWRGTWSSATAYAIDDAVHHNGSAWFAITASTNVEPTESAPEWGVLAVKGDTGAQGPPGVQGPQGDQGEQGDQGVQGVPGPQGDQGIQGIQGDQGIQGVAGPQGIQGPQGDVGPQGSAGAPGAAGYGTANFSIPGIISVRTGTIPKVMTRSGTIGTPRMALGTAPTGASFIVDINLNGVTIYTNQANRPTITAGNTDSGAGTAPDITSYIAGDKLTYDVDQVGSTVAGSDLDVEIPLT